MHEQTIPRISLVTIIIHLFRSVFTMSGNVYSQDSSQATEFVLSTMVQPIADRLRELNQSGQLGAIAISDDDMDSQPFEWQSTPAPCEYTPIRDSRALSSVSASPSPTPSPSGPSTGHIHWGQRSLEILAKAVLAHNPNLCKTNADRGEAWGRIEREFNIACAREDPPLPSRDVGGIKQKWTQMIRKRKTTVAINTRASGILEFTSDHESLLDEFIESETRTFTARSRNRKSATNTAAVIEDRDDMVNALASQASQTAEMDDNPATRSMSTMVERRRPSGASDSGDGVDGSQLRKRARHNATSDVMLALVNSTERHREEERAYRSRYLDFLKADADARNSISQQQIDISSRMSTEFHTKMESLEEQMRSSRNHSMKMESMMSTMMSHLQTLTASSHQPPSCPVLLAPSLQTISQETTPTAQRVRAVSVASDVSTPTKHTRRSSRAPSQPRAGLYGGFDQGLSCMRCMYIHRNHSTFSTAVSSSSSSLSASSRSVTASSRSVASSELVPLCGRLGSRPTVVLRMRWLLKYSSSVGGVHRMRMLI